MNRRQRLGVLPTGSSTAHTMNASHGFVAFVDEMRCYVVFSEMTPVEEENRGNKAGFGNNGLEIWALLKKDF